MPTLTTKSGLRLYFQQLPSKSEVSKSPSLQELVKACGGKFESREDQSDQSTDNLAEPQQQERNTK
jgi:hypothetical protein